MKDMSKSRHPNKLTSVLQQDILKHIVTTRDAGYDTLMVDIKRDRITILQSLETLVKRNYVKKVEIGPYFERNIKFMLKPTTKGIIYSIAFLDVGFDTILKTIGEQNDFVRYNELMKNIVNKSERNEFMKNTAQALIDFDTFDENGEMKITKGEDFFNYGIMMALTGLGRKKSPKSSVYFDNQSIDSLRKIFSVDELKEIQEYYSKVRRYVNTTTDAIDKGLSV